MILYNAILVRDVIFSSVQLGVRITIVYASYNYVRSLWSLVFCFNCYQI